eukprot:Gb_33483 [translate_table: standard]
MSLTEAVSNEAEGESVLKILRDESVLKDESNLQESFPEPFYMIAEQPAVITPKYCIMYFVAVNVAHFSYAINMDDCIDDRQTNYKMQERLKDVGLEDGMGVPKRLKEEPNDADDPVVPFKRRKENNPTMDLLLNVVDATCPQEANSSISANQTECKSDCYRRCSYISNSSDIINGFLPIMHVRTSEERQPDSKGLSSEISWATDISCSLIREVGIENKNGEAESESPANQSVGLTHVNTRAPVVRTSRGRPQMLPARFCDSVLEPWKKGQSKGLKLIDEGLASSTSSPSPDTIHNPSKKPMIKLKGLGVNLVFGSSLNGFKNHRQPPTLKNENHAVKLNMASEHRNRMSIPQAQERSLGSAEMDSVSSFVPKGRVSGVAARGLHPLEEFDLGDIVWAKSGKRRDPAWPAKVIDPFGEAPDTVRSVCVPGRLCVMFFGHSSGKRKERDYAWVKQGMIFPFIEYMDRYAKFSFFMALTEVSASIRFQGQTQLNRSKPSDFKMAIEEAILAEYGFMDLEDCPQNSNVNQGVWDCLMSCRDAHEIAHSTGDPQVESSLSARYKSDGRK